MDTPSPSPSSPAASSPAIDGTREGEGLLLAAALLLARGRPYTDPELLILNLAAMDSLRVKLEKAESRVRELADDLYETRVAHANLLTPLASIDDMTEELTLPTAALVARLRKRWVEGAQ